MNIELKSISVKYKNNYALNDINLKIKDGSFVVLLGENGSGKTTLLKTIAGLIKPVCGEILYDGKNINDIKIKDRDIVYLTQDAIIYPHLNVYDNIAFSLRKEKVDEEEIYKTVNFVAEKFDITYILNRHYKELSIGELRRVSLAKIYISKRSVLLLDEPLVSISEDKRNEYKKYIVDLKNETNKTILYVTHHLDEATLFADYIVYLKDGRVESYKTKNDFYFFPESLSILSLMTNKEYNETDLDINYLDNLLSYKNRKLTILNSGCYIDIKLSNNLLLINDSSILLNEEELGRLLNKETDLIAYIDFNKLSSEFINNSFKIHLEKIEENSVCVKVNLCNQTIYVAKPTNINSGDYYISYNDLDIYDKEFNKIKMSYIIYPNKIIYNKREFIIPKNIDIFSKDIKIKTHVIHEEFINESEKLIYLSSPYEHYFTFIIPSYKIFDYRKTFNILIKKPKL